MASQTGWSGRPGDPGEDLREWQGWEPGRGASWPLVLHTLPTQNTQTLTVDTSRASRNVPRAHHPIR